MRVLLPFKRVPDPETKIRVLPDGSGINSAGVKFVINPFDEIAIEEALRIKERGEATELVGVTIGGDECMEQIRTALAMGCDRAILVKDEGASRTNPYGLDPYAISRILKSVVDHEQPSLVIMGKQAIDDDSNQTGQMLAALLGWPQATFVSKLVFIEDHARAECTRETDDGLEVVRVKLPAVITTDLRLNEPRYVSLPGIMRARNKPVKNLTCQDLEVSDEPQTNLQRLAPPAARPPGKRLDSVEELVMKLREEAKVI